MINRIGLGTAQFGMKYGMINPKQVVSEAEAFNILKMASSSGIDFIDTAVAYGVSEEIIGKFIKGNNVSLNIISKLPKCSVEEVRKITSDSLRRLNTDWLYGYIFHSFGLYRENPKSWEVLNSIKKEKKVKKIGFSLYFTDDLELLLKDNIEFDIIQLPYSLFDRRFEQYFQILKQRRVEIHVRSIFLQGLLFIDPERLHSFFSGIFERLKILREISSERNISILDICLKFVMSNTNIDKAIVGVQTSDQLKQIISCASIEKNINFLSNQLSLLRVDDEKILLPFKWSLN